MEYKKTKKIFLTIELDYVFYTEEKVEEMIKIINELIKGHDEGCQKKTYIQVIVPRYKTPSD